MAGNGSALPCSRERVDSSFQGKLARSMPVVGTSPHEVAARSCGAGQSKFTRPKVEALPNGPARRDCVGLAQWRSRHAEQHAAHDPQSTFADRRPTGSPLDCRSSNPMRALIHTTSTKQKGPPYGEPFFIGGGGGNRTRVRKPSTDSPTCLARPLDLTPRPPTGGQSRGESPWI